MHKMKAHQHALHQSKPCNCAEPLAKGSLWQITEGAMASTRRKHLLLGNRPPSTGASSASEIEATWSNIVTRHKHKHDTNSKEVLTNAPSLPSPSKTNTKPLVEKTTRPSKPPMPSMPLPLEQNRNIVKRSSRSEPPTGGAPMRRPPHACT